MKVSNFKTDELETFYKKDEIFFFNYRKIYKLIRLKNEFSFSHLKTHDKKEGLPYMGRGRFLAAKESFYLKLTT